jgi:AcrR family transcriptional regulator
MTKASPKRGKAGVADADDLSGWQQRALDRSLVEARRRALDKSNGFVQAAMALLDETGNLNFTVQDVVDRSKLSLRSFYQTFASKGDLLLALFEECITATAAWQRD